MNLRGFATCIAMFLCSADGFNAMKCARQWLRLKFPKYKEIPITNIKAN